MQYKTVKGMSDICFPEMQKWQFVESQARQFFGARLYEEIRTPIVEYTELFQRSIGESSDIVNKEMYSFNDRGGRGLTLRPEMTASVIRAVVNNNLLGLRDPLKLLYLGPMFRAERPQAGRKRQFYQIGVEVIGDNSPWCDAEVIRDLAFYLESLGLQKQDISIKLNNVGCNKCRPTFLAMLRDFFSSRLDTLCENCTFKYEKNVLRIFDCKNEQCKSMTLEAPKVTDNVCEECKEHFSAVLSYLDTFGVPAIVDKNIVRGLDYYTSTVFEVTSEKLGAQDAIAAGGRYNNLLKEFGGAQKGAIGFALGFERLLICLETILKDAIPSVLSSSVYVAYGEEEYMEQATQIIARLENRGIPTYSDLDSRSLKSQMKRANKFGFRWVLILNKDDYQSDQCTLKDLCASDDGQCLIALSDLEERVVDTIGGE